MKEKFTIKRKRTILNKVYYKLFVNNKTVGYAWVRRKFSLFRGMYIKINKEYRNKGYGTKFMELLEHKMTEMDVPEYFAITRRTNMAAIKMIENNVDKDTKVFKIGNYLAYEVVLILDWGIDI